MKGFVAYISDSLQHLRSQVSPKGVQQPTWRQICINVVRPVIEVLTTTDVEVYCYCLDALGDIRRLEKKETDNKRYGTGVRPTVMPFQDGTYFHDDEPLSLPMNEFFKDARARVALYLALLKFFKSNDVRAAIPEGKSIIFSGAIELVPTNDRSANRYDSWKRVGPLRITRQGVSVVEEINCDVVCEGDLQVFQLAIWVLRHYPRKGNIMIYSRDGDIPMYALLVLRVFLKINREIKIFCKTERAATLDATARKRKAQENAIASSSKRGSAASASSSSSGRRRSKFQDRYIDICAMVQRMSEEASQLNQQIADRYEIKKLPKKEREAVLKSRRVVAASEEWVAATLISSSKHDYMDPQDFRYGAVDRFAMRAFPWWRHYFTPLVKISRRLRPDEDLLPKGTPHHHVYYVNVKNVDRYIDFCYYEKVFDTFQKKGEYSLIDHDDNPGDGLQQYDETIMKKAKELRIRNEKTALRKLHERIKISNKSLPEHLRRALPTQRERLVSGCARLAWVLHYGGVGAVQESVVVDGTKVDPETNLSIHGFSSIGFDWQVCRLDSEWRKCG